MYNCGYTGNPFYLSNITLLLLKKNTSPFLYFSRVAFSQGDSSDKKDKPGMKNIHQKEKEKAREESYFHEKEKEQLDELKEKKNGPRKKNEPSKKK